MWVTNTPKYATIHSALVCLTNVDSAPDDLDHVQIGRAHIRRDATDLNKESTWFAVLGSHLHNLSTGVAATDADGINYCDEAEKAGLKISSKMDDLVFSEVVMRKVNRPQTLSNLLNKTVSTNAGHKPTIDSTIFFSRLLIMMQRSCDMEP